MFNLIPSFLSMRILTCLVSILFAIIFKTSHYLSKIFGLKHRPLYPIEQSIRARLFNNPRTGRVSRSFSHRQCVLVNHPYESPFIRLHASFNIKIFLQILSRECGVLIREALLQQQQTHISHGQLQHKACGKVFDPYQGRGALGGICLQTGQQELGPHQGG